MATEEELKEIIRKQRGGRWIEYHGPFKIGAADVWEIWTWTNENKDKDDWVPQTRFWLEDGNGSKLYFNYFSDLAPQLHKHFVSAARQGADIDLSIKKEIEALKLKRISLYVASIVFIAAVGGMIVALFTGVRDTPWMFISALAGVVSSGAVLFYGVWRPITPPRMASRNSRRSPVQP